MVAVSEAAEPYAVQLVPRTEGCCLHRRLSLFTVNA
jgi:hypothetical protein